MRCFIRTGSTTVILLMLAGCASPPSAEPPVAATPPPPASKSKTRNDVLREMVAQQRTNQAASPAKPAPTPTPDVPKSPVDIALDHLKNAQTSDERKAALAELDTAIASIETGLHVAAEQFSTQMRDVVTGTWPWVGTSGALIEGTIAADYNTILRYHHFDADGCRQMLETGQAHIASGNQFRVIQHIDLYCEIRMLDGPFKDQIMWTRLTGREDLK